MRRAKRFHQREAFNCV